MKKFLFLIVAIIGIACASHAQVWKQAALTAGDTIVTSSSKDTVSKVVTATAGYSSAAFKVEYTKISGTVALKAYIYPGDGTDFESSPTDSSAAFSNGSGYVYFTKTVPLPYSHYKIAVRGSDGSNSTQSVKIIVKYLFKKYDD